MARSTRSAKLETRTATIEAAGGEESRSSSRSAPGSGSAIGGTDRRNLGGAGRGRRGGNWTKAIGSADDFEDADNSGVLDFWQAQDKARASREARGEAAAGAKPATVGQALAAYEADLKTRGADTGNVARVRAHLPAALLNKAVALLASRELRRWRDGLAERMAPAKRQPHHHRNEGGAQSGGRTRRADRQPSRMGNRARDDPGRRAIPQRDPDRGRGAGDRRRGNPQSARSLGCWSNSRP